MKALYVYESLDFERGKDPKKSMGVGLSAKVYKDMLALNQEPGVLGMQFKRGMQGEPRLFVKYVGDIWKPMLGNKSYWEELVDKHIGKYVQFNLGNPDDEYFSFPISPEYSQIIEDILNGDVN